MVPAPQSYLPPRRAAAAVLALLLIAPGEVLAFVAFVDNSAVDLKWRPESDCVRQEIRYRDGATIATLGPTDSYYRIDGLAKGQAYEFEVCCWREYGSSCPIVQVTTGEVHGVLHRDREWSSGEYELFGSVFVEEGVTLAIRGVSVRTSLIGGVGIVSAHSDPLTGQRLGPGGVIRIDGATFGELIGLTFSAGGDNVVRNSTMRLHTGGRHYVTDAADLLVSGNTFFKGGFHVSGEASVTVVDNRFEGTAISLVSTGQSQIAGNQFIEPANVRAIEQERGRSTITDNVLTAPNAPQSAWTAIAVNNYRVDPPETVAADILDNTITGFPTGVILGGTAAVDARLAENRFSENGTAVVVTKQTRVQMEGNDFLRNATAIQLRDTPSAEVHDNCIATNTDYGVDSRTSVPVDATGNWWGAPSGPRHPSNPGGAGDVVRGDMVDFSGWLQAPNCEGERPTPTAILVKSATPAPTPMRTATEASTPTPTPTPDLDFAADHLEVVQTIQDLGNHVRLVAGKRTFARFHVRSSRDRTLTTARLRIGSGPAAATVSPIARAAGGSGDIYVRATPNRGAPYEAFLFELPNRLEGQVMLTAEVNPARMPEERSYANNTAAAQVTFEAVPPVYLVLYDMQYLVNGVRYSIRETDAAALTAWLRRVYPLADLRVERRSVLYSVGVPSCLSVNVFLGVKRNWDLLVNLTLTGPRAQVRYYGMIDDRATNWGLSGMAGGIPAFVACGGAGVPQGGWDWDTDGSYADWLGGHELGHAYGRHHAEFCGAQAGVLGLYPVGYEPYPYRNGDISPSRRGPDAFYGFDTCHGPQCLFSIINPGWNELMTYCHWVWISDFTYHRLMNAFQAFGAATAAQPASPVVDRMLVSGVIDLTTTAVSLEPLFVLPQVADVEPPVPGAYAIVLRDAALRQLARYPFTPRVTQDDPPPDSEDEPLVVAYFSEAVPYVEGTVAVDIEGPGGRLHRASAGASAPTVQVVSPNGGETFSGDTIEVRWAGSDPDGDPLAFHVEYSAGDGERWELVAQNIAGDRTEIDRLNLVGSDRARVRVWASDGIHSARDESDQPFRVANAPPRLAIVAPPGPITVAAGQTVHFAADAYDADLGAAGGDAVEWRSSRDGVLGGGASLSTATLGVGTHTITCALDDGAGSVASDSVDVTVVSDVAELPPVPDGLDVAPVQVLLDPALGESRETLAIENRNPARSIAWQAAATETWLALSPPAGSTPATVEATFTGTTLPPGHYDATVTVTSAVLPGVEEQVRVELVLRAPPACLGDCDGGGAVTINELITGVNIALSTLPLAQCPAFTRNYDGLVTIDELIAAVNNALGRCPAAELVRPFVTSIRDRRHGLDEPAPNTPLLRTM